MGECEAPKCYFKVDRQLAEISGRTLSEKALKVYLMHCRRLNQKKNLGCSLAGANDAKQCAGIPDKKLYQKAVQELEEKFLIAQRPDVKTGYLKAVPVEILNFPLYDAKNKRFRRDPAESHAHRTYKHGQYMNIPSIIVDEGFLKQFDTDTILTMLKLYNMTDFKTWYGVDFRKLHCYSPEHPKGYIPLKKENLLSQAVETTRYKCNCSIDCGRINELHSKGLFTYAPALVYQDPNDIEYGYVIEILKPNEKNNYILRTPKNEGQKVITIIQPKHYIEAYFKDIDSS
jgi:hypothetical protein